MKKKRLFVVVDFQNDFVTGSLGFPKAKDIEEHICKKIKEYRENGDEIAFTFDTHDDSYMESQEGKNLPIPHCIKGTQGWELYGCAKDLIADGDKRFEKGAFGSVEFFDYLRERDYESIELAGLVTNICIISNAILAKTALPEVEVIVDADCVASADDAINEKTLDVLEGLHVKVVGRK